ncbi:MAG: hypothetical protein KIT09_28770 [Bryobacteraceae bacterium]|nr:hypothetical protein [Bryobacteraceae bacterium]
MGEIARYLRERSVVGTGRFSRSIWFHGNTVESFAAAGKLIRDLRRSAPDCQFVFTTGNPGTLPWLEIRYSTDAALAVPWNVGAFAGRFLRRFSPRVLVLLESAEGLPPTLWRRLRKAEIPVAAVNVRDEPGLSNTTLALACVQDEAAAARLTMAGHCGAVCVTGSLNLDAPSSAAGAEYLRREFGLAADAPAMLAENVPPEEEEIVLDLFHAFRARHSGLVLLLEPAAAERTGAILERLKARQLPGHARSQSRSRPEAAVVVFDRPGEASNAYPLVSFVLAGGSLSGKTEVVNLAGAASLGKPVVFGPRLTERAWLPRLLIQHGAAVQFSVERMEAAVIDLLGSPIRRNAIARQAEQLLARRQGASARTMEALAPFLPPPSPEPLASHSWRILTFRERVGESAAWARCARFLMRRRIDGWAALRDRLGRPRSILCLGNGPSSEHPDLRDARFDCLMRVNWLWKQRGFLTQPHVVFVGDLRALRELTGCVFGFLNVQQETSALLRYLLLHGPRPPEYFTFERLARNGYEGLSARPSNGALMVATAAALQPERLIVAGLDLFLHPDGRYPGDLRTSNEYSQVHTAECDIEFIRRALAGYRGEAVILSEILREALASVRGPETPVAENRLP